MINSRKKISLYRYLQILLVPILVVTFSVAATASEAKINRKKIVEKFSPSLTKFDKLSPFTLGNGEFAFTADVTGLQSFVETYYAAGFPLETKSRWAWHSKAGHFDLFAANETYKAYGREVEFPTNINSSAAEWLRQNPHDLPLGSIGLLLDNQHLNERQISEISQRLDLWRGKLTSQFDLDGKGVTVKTLVHSSRDLIGYRIESSMNRKKRLSVEFRFPRGYDFLVKNTPNMDWSNTQQHQTKVIQETDRILVLKRQVDDLEYFISIQAKQKVKFQQTSTHEWTLSPISINQLLEFSVEYSKQAPKSPSYLGFSQVEKNAADFWKSYWQQGGFVDVTPSSNPQALELQRRIILSQYILGVQQRSTIPAQETGLTSSSWYGKFHTEMAWLQYSHWLLWNKQDYALPMLNWYQDHLPVARAIAKSRGLQGARWPKMVGPNAQESPGGNPLIIWNQPHPIYLVGILYKKSGDKRVLQDYAELIEETAQAMSSMLVWDEKNQRYNLDAPIWISQEIYTPTETLNPTFELAYWKYGLELAQVWREMLGKEKNPVWQKQIEQMAELPIKDGKYVAIESIPDTFDNPHSREDHPSMLAPTAFFADRHIDANMMNNTLDAVLKTWAFDTKIWGWDYPMLAMAAARLERNDAVDLLLMKSKNNFYLNNGHCPQLGADLPVYLPANSSLLTAVAVMLEKNAEGEYLGFPKKLGWNIRVDGF